MISPAETAGAYFGFKNKEAFHGPFAPEVAVAACRIFLGFEDRDVWTVARDIGCSVEFLVGMLEQMSVERGAMKRVEEGAQ